MIPRTPSNNAKMAKAINLAEANNWSADDANRFVVAVVAKADNSGYLLHIHQDMQGHNRLKPARLGDKWVIETGPIDFDEA